MGRFIGADATRSVVTAGGDLPATGGLGEIRYDTTRKKLWLWNGATWQVSGQTDEWENNSGSTMLTGYAVEIDPAGNGTELRLATAADDKDIIGVVALEAEDGGPVVVAFCGHWTARLKTGESISIGDHLQCSTTDGVGEVSSPSSGAYCAVKVDVAMSVDNQEINVWVYHTDRG